MTTTKTVTIHEQGNGFPGEGDILLLDGSPVRIVSLETTIHTGDLRGNYIHAEVEDAEWPETDDDVFAARVEVSA